MIFNTNHDQNEEIQSALETVKAQSEIQQYYHHLGPKQYSSFAADSTPSPSINDEPTADSINQALFGKKQIIGDRIQGIAYQIQARKDLYKQNMDHIDAQDCGISAKIDIIHAKCPTTPLDFAMQRRKQSLEQELHQLHSDRRRERVNAWDDIQRLYKDLQESLEEYKSAGDSIDRD